MWSPPATTCASTCISFTTTGTARLANARSRRVSPSQFGGLNIIQADYNNDGCVDILVLRGGWQFPMGLSLLKNNCDGTFTDVTSRKRSGRLCFRDADRGLDRHRQRWQSRSVRRERAGAQPSVPQQGRRNVRGHLTLRRALTPASQQGCGRRRLRQRRVRGLLRFQHYRATIFSGTTTTTALSPKSPRRPECRSPGPVSPPGSSITTTMAGLTCS